MHDFTKEELGCCCFTALIILAIVALIGFDLYISIRTTDIVATVIDKPVDEGNIYFVVEFEDGTREVLSNNDSVTHLKFNSRDFIAKIEVGKTYKFTVNSMRIPLISEHRNIISAEEIAR